VSFVGDIIRKTSKPVKLNIFAGGAATSRGGFGAFLRSFDKALGGVTADLYPHLDYAEYMAKLEEGDFAIDCYPFAGSNTVSDNLHLRKPVVCRIGGRWFNRIGPAMLRSCGMDETVAYDDNEFRMILTEMIVNDEWRDHITRRLQSADLSSTVYRRQGAKEFAGWLAGQIESART
jgi:predicted O-linked N-acetylglucosamine transferase (SPINDLY family)